MTKAERQRLENSKFTCSICNKSIKNKDGYYMKWDKDRSVKVCNIHVPDIKANKEELSAYKFVEKWGDKK